MLDKICGKRDVHSRVCVLPNGHDDYCEDNYCNPLEYFSDPDSHIEVTHGRLSDVEAEVCYFPNLKSV